MSIKVLDDEIDDTLTVTATPLERALLRRVLDLEERLRKVEGEWSGILGLSKDSYLAKLADELSVTS